MWCSAICMGSQGGFLVSILGGFRALNRPSRVWPHSRACLEWQGGLETPKVPSTMNYLAMEDGAFGKPPQSVHWCCSGWGNGSALLAQSSSSGTFFPLSQAAIMTPDFRSRLASSRMHPRANRRDFPLCGMSVPIVPKSRGCQRAGWFHPKPPRQIPRVCQEGFGHGLVRAHLRLWLPPEDAQHWLWVGHRPQHSHSDSHCLENTTQGGGTRKTP